MNTYGVMATTVAPNSKCNSCLHFNSQRGPTGVCEIGLRPITCGDGDMPSIGYAPVHAIGPDAPGGHAPVGQAPIQPGKNLVPASALYRRNMSNTEVIAMQVLALGEEHADMVKSTIRRMTYVCPDHQRSSTIPSPQSIGNFQKSMHACACRAPKADRVAKSLESQLNNRQRVELGERAGDFCFAFASAILSGDDVHKSLTDMVVEKGFYGDDWLAQFKGTDMFDDAVALCEEDLALEEENLAKRAANSKANAARRVAMAALETQGSSDDWDGIYQKQDALRLKKQKLVLKLNKKTFGNVAKSIEETIIKAGPKLHPKLAAAYEATRTAYKKTSGIPEHKAAITAHQAAKPHNSQPGGAAYHQMHIDQHKKEISQIKAGTHPVQMKSK